MMEYGAEIFGVFTHVAEKGAFCDSLPSAPFRRRSANVLQKLGDDVG